MVRGLEDRRRLRLLEAELREIQERRREICRVLKRVESMLP